MAAVLAGVDLGRGLAENVKPVLARPVLFFVHRECAGGEETSEERRVRRSIRARMSDAHSVCVGGCCARARVGEHALA